MNARLIVPLVLAVLVQGAAAQAELDAGVIARIDTVFAGAASHQGPGYVLGVVKDGKLLYAKGFGSANLDDGIAITPKTAFHLASLSKQFTASAVALLVLDGRLRLDDPVERYIPEARRYGPRLRIEHLVYMTSGLVDYTAVKRPNGDPWFSDSYFDINDALNASLSQPLAFEPGQQWAYRNINFMLLARIVEKISGQSLAAFLKERMFEPLGMTQTLVDDDSTQVIPHRAVGYAPRSARIVEELHKVGIKARDDGDWVRLNRVSPHYGGSGVFSSIDDLAIWEDNFDHPRVGGQAYVSLMYRTARFRHAKVNDAFGLVWRDFHGQRMLDYAGEDLDANTYMAHFPDSHSSIVCLSNILTGDCEAKAHAVMEILVSDSSVMSLP
jgi:CubicO group peptidase (beta-lactamase class C family)